MSLLLCDDHRGGGSAKEDSWTSSKKGQISMVAYLEMLPAERILEIEDRNLETNWDAYANRSMNPLNLGKAEKTKCPVGWKHWSHCEPLAN